MLFKSRAQRGSKIAATLRLASFLAVFAASGCASIASGAYAKPVDARGRLSNSHTTGLGLVINGRELDELSSPNFGFVELTFTNTSSAWIRIQRVDLLAGDPGRKGDVFLPRGRDLDSWARATMLRNRVRQANAELALGALALTGAIVEAGASERSAKIAGGAVAVGALGGLVAEGARETVNEAEEQELYPDSHLLSVPFAVPPGLFTKKFVLLNTPADPNASCVDSLLIAYETEGGTSERVWLRFRNEYSRSEWQRGICRRSRRR